MITGGAGGARTHDPGIMSTYALYAVLTCGFACRRRAWRPQSLGVAAPLAEGGTVGYADLSQAGDLGVARIGVGGEFVAPTAEAAAAVIEGSEPLPGRGPYDFALELDRTTAESGSYPIVLVSYHLGCIAYEDQLTADLVADFMSYVVSEEGQAAAAEVAGSAPISDVLREQARTAIDAINTAS